MAHPVYPPLDGTVLLSDLPDFNLQHNPTLPAFVYSSTPESITEISLLEFARACHRVAHAVRPNRAGPEGEIVALIANTDTILYQALIAGMVRAGIVPFPISPRNSAEAVISMLQKTSCHRILATRASLSPLLTSIASLTPADFPLSIEEIPTLAQCYPYLGREMHNDPFVPYPTSQMRRGMNDVTLYLHSSGSTGFPKPIPQTNITILHWYSIDTVTEFRSPALRTAVMHLPPFHTLGINMQLYVPLSAISSVSVYPPTSFTDHAKAPVIPTSDNIIEHSKNTRANCAVVVPSFLEIWSSEPENVEWLKTLQFINFSGGPLSPKIGNALAQSGVNIRSVYGGTEFGGVSTNIDGTTQNARKYVDWSWTRFSGRVKVRWVPYNDKVFECQLLSTETHQLSVENLPDCKGYATSDLWEPHPTENGFWRIVGRVDDVLMLASGEKVVPAPMEKIIVSSPLIEGALIFGRGRNQAGVLIEPRPGVEVSDFVEFRNKIWPVIEEANNASPAFSRIFKEMILVTNSEKPMLRTPKGTVMKKATLDIYENEIDALYDTVEASAKGAENIEPPKSWSSIDLESWLVMHAADIHSGKRLDVEADLFEQGFDSLSATFLRNRIMGALRSSSDPDAQKAAVGVTQNIVFSFPTIKQLAAHIADLVLHRGAADVASAPSAKDAINKMIEKYAVGLGDFVPSSDQPTGGAVVLLTGSTGGLGSQLLESLLSNPGVRKVYAYNRPSKAPATVLERQKDAFEDRGLDGALLHSEKLVFVEGNSALPKLGLEDNLFEEIRTSTTLIIHNAWRLDFNLSLASFEPNIRSTRNLIDLALASPQASTLRFLFTSSVTSAQAWNPSKGAFPEEVQTDVGVAVGGGYGEGKYVAERILAKSGLQATSFRIGQISGGLPNGAWSTTDWVPSLTKSSLKLGALPDAQGLVSWLPMHAVSKAILDVAFAKEPPTIALNIVHPRPVEWSTVMRGVSDALLAAKVTSKTLPLLPFGEWFKALEERAKAADEHDMSSIPAIKLLKFFRTFSLADAIVRESGRKDIGAGGLVAFSTDKLQAASPTMNSLPLVSADDAQRWVTYWSAKGFFE